jgi:DNA-directed RNA polymerase subunit L
MVVVKNFKVVDLAPKIPDPKIAALLPNTLTPQHAEFELHGVHIGIANGLRRCIMSEIPIKAMNFDFADFTTNDPFILNDFISGRIRNIPIKQNVSEKATFSLDVQNQTEEIIYVKSGQIKGNLPFNETFTVTALEPNKFIKISKIYIETGYPYNYGGFVGATNVVCVPLDQIPYNNYTGEGVRSAISNPVNHKIAFNTNGTISPKDIIVSACGELTRRLNLALGELPNITVENNTYLFILHAENDTLGNMLMKTLVDMFPDLPTVTYTVDHINRNLTMKLISNVEVDGMITTAVKKCIEQLEMIKDSFSKK